MSDGLQTRLDRAITEARKDMRAAAQDWAAYFEAYDDERRHVTPKTYEEREADYDASVETFAALVALRARLAEISRMPCPAGHHAVCGRQDELTAEAERLLGEDA